MKDLVLILSGPSGSGKSSLIKKIYQEIDNYYFSISTTTRDIRKNEIDGRDYFFTTKEQFEEGIQNNLFLEYAKVHNNYYGTSLIQVNKALRERKLVILDIDVQGQEKVVEKIGNICTSVFITTKKQKDLKERLIKRNTDSMDTIEKRLQVAKQEMPHIKNYDYILVNDDLDETSKKLINIIYSMSSRVRKDKIDDLIKSWN